MSSPRPALPGTVVRNPASFPRGVPVYEIRHSHGLGFGRRRRSQLGAKDIQPRAIPRQVIESPAVERPYGIVTVTLEGRPRQVSRSLGPDPDVPAIARHMVEGDAAAIGRDPRAVIAPALLEQDAHLAITAHPHQVALGARDVRHGPVLRHGELGEPDTAHR